MFYLAGCFCLVLNFSTMSKRATTDLEVGGSRSKQPHVEVAADVVHEVVASDGATGGNTSGEPETLNNGSQSGIDLNLNLDSALDNHAQVQQQAFSLHSNIGVHVSEALRDKIANGHYVDLESLLPTKTESNENRVSITPQGELVLKPATPKMKINSIETWTDAFIIFSSIYSVNNPDKIQALLKYMNTIRTGAKRHGGMGWKSYDQQFRLRIASDNTMSFDTIDYELWLLYMTSNQYVSQSHQQTIRKCFDFNYRTCSLQNCQYRHACLRCNLSHPSRYCRNRNFARGSYSWRAPVAQGQPRASFRPKSGPRFIGPRFA